MGRLKIPSAAKYRKRIKSFVGLDVKRDESVVDFSCATRCYNFDFSSGALKDGYGIGNHAFVPREALRYWVYRFTNANGERLEQYIYQQPSGHLRYYDPTQDRIKYVATVAYEPIEALSYRLNSADVLLVSCKGRGLMVWDGLRFVEHKSPAITSMALHYERLFVTSADQPTKIFFSDDLDPTNWNTDGDAGGFIELLDERGDLNKVVSFGNYLYIFRDHGISRVTAYGDQSEFAVTGLFVTAGRIYPSSICKCGACIMFLASDGLYVFDGYDCTRRLVNLDGLIVPDDNCSAAFFGGKYYLACRMEFGDERKVGCETDDYTVNALLVYDVTTGEYSVSRGLNITALSACTFRGEDFLAACDGGRGGVIVRNGSRFESVLDKHWQSPASDFGTPDRVKTLREVYTDAVCKFDLTLTADDKAKTLNVLNGACRNRVNMSCKRLSLAIDVYESDCNVRAPTVVYSSR